MKVLKLNEFKVEERVVTPLRNFTPGVHIESGVWHGENATILYKDLDFTTFIVGDYSENELRQIQKLFDEDSPALSKYDDVIMSVYTEVWEEQQDY